MRYEQDEIDGHEPTIIEQYGPRLTTEQAIEAITNAQKEADHERYNTYVNRRTAKTPTTLSDSLYRHIARNPDIYDVDPESEHATSNLEVAARQARARVQTIGEALVPNTAILRLVSAPKPVDSTHDVLAFSPIRLIVQATPGLRQPTVGKSSILLGEDIRPENRLARIESGLATLIHKTALTPPELNLLLASKPVRANNRESLLIIGQRTIAHYALLLAEAFKNDASSQSALQSYEDLLKLSIAESLMTDRTPGLLHELPDSPSDIDKIRQIAEGMK